MPVDTVDSEDFDGTQGSPEDSGGEEGVDTRAGKVVDLSGRANSWNRVHLEVEHTSADEAVENKNERSAMNVQEARGRGCDYSRRDEDRNHLRKEGVLGGDLDVVTELHVVSCEKERNRCQ